MKLLDFSQAAVRTKEELTALIGTPHELVIKKTVSILDENCKRFISLSPLLFLSTCSADGKCDVSPRGDFPSSIKILNEKQLIIPDRPGNKRLDSIHNMLSNPHVGLLFIIPGMEEVLRINGKATIIKNETMLNDIWGQGQAPKLGIGVDVEECFIHCPRALKSSKVWDSSSWRDKSELPSSTEMFHAHLKLNGVELKK